MSLNFAAVITVPYAGPDNKERWLPAIVDVAHVHDIGLAEEFDEVNKRFLPGIRPAVMMEVNYRGNKLSSGTQGVIYIPFDAMLVLAERSRKTGEIINLQKSNTPSLLDQYKNKTGPFAPGL